jgi:hypothetical protein
MDSIISGQLLQELKKIQSTAPMLFPERAAASSARFLYQL